MEISAHVEGGDAVSIFDQQSEHLDELLGRLDGVVADLRELSLLGLRASEVNTLLLRLIRLNAEAQGLEFSAIQEAEAAAMTAHYDSRTLATHLAKATHCSAKAIGVDRALALWLNNFGEFHTALLDGVLSKSHLFELRSIDSPKVHALLVRDQHLLIQSAELCAWDEWKQIVGYWLHAADPDGELADPTDAQYGMTVHTKANGDVHVSIVMDPITGEAFLNIHEAERDKLDRSEREARDEGQEVEQLTVRQHNLKALMRVLVRGAKREDGSAPTPLVNIVMSEKVAEDLLARTFGHETPTGEPAFDVDPFEMPIAWDDIDGRCETIRGTPIHPKHALGLLLVGKLRRTIMGAHDQVINLGRDVRFFTQAQRFALLIQQRGKCAFGTQTPYAWLHADHITPFSKGGLTDLKNGQMIASAENLAKGDSEE